MAVADDRALMHSISSREGSADPSDSTSPSAAPAAALERTVDFSPSDRASMDETTAQLVGPTGRRAATFEAADPLLHSLSRLLRDEANRLKQHGSSSMSVALHADEATELFVHFSQAPEGIDVHVRCEAGDLARLTTIWTDLTQAVAPRLRLAPLRDPREPEAARFTALAGGVGRSHPERRRRFRRPGWETWA